MSRLLAPALLVLIGACRSAPPVELSATPSAGISIALYQLGDRSYAVIDDRRWVEVKNGMLELDRLDPGAALPTLVLEPLAGSRLVVGNCSRDMVEMPKKPMIDREDLDPGLKEMLGSVRMFAMSNVQCEVTGPPGRHLVRVLYVSDTLAYRAQHGITMSAAEHAMLTTRYAISTPSWGTKAEVTLYDGMPGGEQAPLDIARGQIVLDGSTAILATAPRPVGARLRRIYTGEMSNGSDEDDAMSDTIHAVWVWLELDGVRLAPGPVHAEVRVIDEDTHEVDIPAAGREQGNTSLRLPLWIDPALRGSRTRRRVGRDQADMAEWFSLSITNTGEVAREVWIEQRLQEGARRRIATYGQPAKPTLGKQRARSKVNVAPQKTARVAYTITYTF